MRHRPPLAILLVLLGLVLVGCAPQWSKPGISEQQKAADEFDCRARVTGVGRMDTGHLSGPIGGAPGFGTGFAQGVATGSVLAAARERRDMLELCMKAKGYVKE